MTVSERTSPNGSKLIKLHEARKILGISSNKIAHLVSTGALPFETNPLDRRVKLVRLRDVQALQRIGRQSR